MLNFRMFPQQQPNRPTPMFPQQQQGRPTQTFPQQQQSRQMPISPQQQHGQMQMPSQQQPHGQMQMPSQQQPHEQMQMPSQQQPQAIDPMIQFEPFNESMLKMPSPTSVPTPAVPATPTLVQDTHITEKLSKLIQNEKNASMYYQNLANSSPYKHVAAKLTRAGDHAQQHFDTCNEIYKSYRNEPYEAKEERVIKDIEFYEGVRMAIAEENDSLNELTDLYDSIHDEKNLRLLNVILYKKLGLLSHLHAMSHMM